MAGALAKAFVHFVEELGAELGPDEEPHVLGDMPFATVEVDPTAPQDHADRRLPNPESVGFGIRPAISGLLDVAGVRIGAQQHLPPGAQGQLPEQRRRLSSTTGVRRAAARSALLLELVGPQVAHLLERADR